MNGFPVPRALKWMFPVLLLGATLTVSGADVKPNGIIFAVRRRHQDPDRAIRLCHRREIGEAA